MKEQGVPQRVAAFACGPAAIRLRELLSAMRAYLGFSGASHTATIATPEALGRFIETRASHVAQTALYGYLRTRAGTRYPDLFDNDAFAAGINIAKWQIWLACVSDLAVFAGGLLYRSAPESLARSSAEPSEAVGGFVTTLVAGILARAGVPAEADATFPANAERVRDRLTATDWATVEDGEGCFSESPEALVVWAPVIDELKQLDAAIVRNSVRFRWQEVRRDMRRHLDPAAVMRHP